jgi:exonuclease III
MASSNIDFSVITFNLHGFNQGGLYLNELCTSGKYDLIGVQEHWLAPSCIVKLKSLSKNYSVYGKSAMETIVSIGPLRGRPWGGAAIMVKKQYCPYIKHIVVDDRFVLIVINDCTFVNVYMPVDDGSHDSLNIVLETLR